MAVAPLSNNLVSGASTPFKPTNVSTCINIITLGDGQWWAILLSLLHALLACMLAAQKLNNSNLQPEKKCADTDEPVVWKAFAGVSEISSKLR